MLLKALIIGYIAIAIIVGISLTILFFAWNTLLSLLSASDSSEENEENGWHIAAWIIGISACWLPLLVMFVAVRIGWLGRKTLWLLDG